ncbi:hypothetical protein [Treponema lecithinolyticum]
MKEFIIAGCIFAGAVFFLIRHFYRVFSGKGSACSCGTHKYTVKNGTLLDGTDSGCCGCCKNCACDKK